MAQEFFTGLDIGTSSVKVVVGQRIPSETGEEENIHIIGSGEFPSAGVSKGVITSIDDAVSVISSALERAERMTGVPVEQAYVAVNGLQITSQDSHGVIAVSKSDGEISDDDVMRVVEAAQAVATPPNYEILHVIPRSFVVDNQQSIKDPIGMNGIRLEVDAQIIQTLSSQVKSLTKCVYRAGVDINDLVLGGLAASEAVLTQRQKDLGVALIDIGASTMQLLVFEEGDLLHTKIFPLGAGHITNDIAIGLRTSIDTAEQIKLTYGTAVPSDVGKREEIRLEEFSQDENSAVSRLEIAEIIEARVEEMFEMVDKELTNIDRSGTLPAGVVLSGGGARLPGVVEVAKKHFRLPAAIGRPQNASSSIEKMDDPAYATAIGLVVWGGGAEQSGRGSGMLRPLSGATSKVKKWISSLMP
ncbi:MAG: cell division protein FtsA [Patescibacteria group bacterium]|jgi:cell division protein FtsA